MKKFYIIGAIGLVIGNFLATYFGPVLLTWWFESPVNMAINCSEPIMWAMQNLIKVQTIGSIIGLLGGIGMAFLFFSKDKKESKQVE